jgi:hypothetical protein
MNLNFMDLLQPTIERFNTQAQKLSEFIEKHIKYNDIIFVCVKGKYGAIERITISSKISNYAIVDLYVFMDNTINIIYSKELQEVVRVDGINLWDPAELQKEILKISSFFEKGEIN